MLFFGTLPSGDPGLEVAKVGILVASISSGVTGAVIPLNRRSGHPVPSGL